MKYMSLSDAEWKIAGCLWNYGSMTITELTKALGPTSGWSKNTIITLLKRMIDKEAVAFIQEDKAKRFYMLIDRPSAVIDETIAFIDKVYNGDVERMMKDLFRLKDFSYKEYKTYFSVSFKYDRKSHLDETT